MWKTRALLQKSEIVLKKYEIVLYKYEIVLVEYEIVLVEYEIVLEKKQKGHINRPKQVLRHNITYPSTFSVVSERSNPVRGTLPALSAQLPSSACYAWEPWETSWADATRCGLMHSKAFVSENKLLYKNLTRGTPRYSTAESLPVQKNTNLL